MSYSFRYFGESIVYHLGSSLALQLLRRHYNSPSQHPPSPPRAGEFKWGLHEQFQGRGGVMGSGDGGHLSKAVLS